MFSRSLVKLSHKANFQGQKYPTGRRAFGWFSSSSVSASTFSTGEDESLNKLNTNGLLFQN